MFFIKKVLIAYNLLLYLINLLSHVQKVFYFILFIVGLKSFAQIDVTFKVDMQYQIVSANGIYIAGSMQGWDPTSTSLSDNNGDNIWEVTLTLDENTVYEYKFINGNSWGSDETVVGDCSAGNGNRQLSTTNEKHVIISICL